MSSYDVTDDIEGSDARKAYDEAKAMFRGNPSAEIEDVLERLRKHFFSRGYAAGRRDMVTSAQAIIRVSKEGKARKR